MKLDAQQYFANKPESKSEAKPFNLDWQGQSFRFYTDHGVFSRGELDLGTKVLLEALPKDFSGQFLDLGCGWGPVGLLMKASNPQAEITLSDTNERAVALTRRNAKENKLTVQVITGDGFENIQGDFDMIAINPPIRAGKATIYRYPQTARGGQCAKVSQNLVSISPNSCQKKRLPCISM